MKTMKYSMVILVLLLLCKLPAFAQEDSTKSEGDVVVVDNKLVKVVVTEKGSVQVNDSTRITTETVQIIRKNKGDTITLSDDGNNEHNTYRTFDGDDDEDEGPDMFETSWFDFQVGLNNLLNSDNSLEMPAAYEDMSISTGNSFNLHWHIVRQSVSIYKEKVRFIYGIGIDYNNYRLQKNVLLRKASDSLGKVLSVTESGIDYKKNKLVTQYLTVPMMLSFDFGNGDKDGFKLGIGANMGYLIGSHQKLKWKDNGKQVSKFRDDFNLEKYRIGYEIQFGYHNLMLYAKYFPNSMFKQGLGPDVRTVSAGIVLGSI